MQYQFRARKPQKRALQCFSLKKVGETLRKKLIVQSKAQLLRHFKSFYRSFFILAFLQSAKCKKVNRVTYILHKINCTQKCCFRQITITFEIIKLQKNTKKYNLSFLLISQPAMLSGKFFSQTKAEKTLSLMLILFLLHI